MGLMNIMFMDIFLKSFQQPVLDDAPQQLEVWVAEAHDHRRARAVDLYSELEGLVLQFTSTVTMSFTLGVCGEFVYP